MSGSGLGFVCWEGLACVLTGAGQVPGLGGAGLCCFSSSLSVYLHPRGTEPYPCPGFCLPSISPSPLSLPLSSSLSPCCSPSPGLSTEIQAMAAI